MAVWTPPVNLPDLGGNDYGRELYEMTAGPGAVLGQQRQDRTQALQFSAQEERLKQQGIMDYGASMAKIAADSNNGMFQGTGLEQQAYNYVLTLPQDDPRYAVSYNLLTQPKTSLEPGADGQLHPVTITPTLPPNILPPVYGGDPAASAPAGDPTTPYDDTTAAPPPAVLDPSGGAVITEPRPAPRSNVSVGDALKGTGKAATAEQAKARTLYEVVEPELRTINKNFDSLTETGNIIGGFAPDAARALVTSPEYQQARNSLQTIISSYLYYVSGQAATANEVATQTDNLLPVLGGDPKANNAKKARINTLVKAISLGLSPEDARARFGDRADALGGGSSGGEVIDVGDGITMERD